MANRPEMFGPIRGFPGWPIQWNHTKCCGPTLVAMATKFGLKSSITPLEWQIDRICLHLPGGFRGWPIQWNHTKCCGPTLVATATEFGLSVEIQLPTACPDVCLSVNMITNEPFQISSQNYRGIILWSKERPNGYCAGGGRMVRKHGG